MADRVLNAFACLLAVLMPLAVFLAAAVLMGAPTLAVLVLWGGWLLVMGGIVTVAARMLRGPQISHHTTRTARGR